MDDLRHLLGQVHAVLEQLRGERAATREGDLARVALMALSSIEARLTVLERQVECLIDRAQMDEVRRWDERRSRSSVCSGPAS